jgi:amino acid transporter
LRSSWKIQHEETAGLTRKPAIQNPVRSLKIYATAALTAVYILYMLANVAFFAAGKQKHKTHPLKPNKLTPKTNIPIHPVPKEELQSSKLTTAALFFKHVFGDSGAVRGLNFLIALASFGNMIAVVIGLSRRIREAGRQGVLPWTEFCVSTQPFGTPLGPYAVIWGLTALMIVAVPAGDAFTFGTWFRAPSGVEAARASLTYIP